MRPAQFARQCLAFWVGQVRQSHILKVRPGNPLAKLFGQGSRNLLQHFFPVFSPHILILLMLDNHSSDVPVGGEQCLIDLLGQMASSLVHDCAYLGKHFLLHDVFCLIAYDCHDNSLSLFSMTSSHFLPQHTPNNHIIQCINLFLRTDAAPKTHVHPCISQHILLACRPMRYAHTAFVLALARVTTRAYGSLAPAICDTRVVLYFPHAMHRLLEITAKCFSAQVI